MLNFRKIFSCFILLLCCHTCFLFSNVSDELPAPPLSLIVDTDMGNDDVMAFLSLFRKPNVQIQAITVTGSGLAHAKEGFRNLQYLLRFCNKSEIPIALGREEPIQGGRFFPDYLRTMCDTLLDPMIAKSEEIEELSSLSAVELLRNTLESSPDKMTILALGPLTNLAELFQKYPELVKKVEKLHIMGGAVDVPGNLYGTEGNAAAEWNIFADPLAAKEVFQLGIPIVLIGLDVTNQVPLTQEFYDHVAKNHKTPSAGLFHQLLQHARIGSFYFWDLQAIEILIDPSLAEFENRTVDIVTTEGTHYGQTLSCDTGYPIQLATKIDGEKFLQVYFDTINSWE